MENRYHYGTEADQYAFFQIPNADAETQLISAIEKDSTDKIRLYYLDAEKILPKIGKAVRKHGLTVPSGIIHSVLEDGSPVKLKITGQTKTRQFRNWFGSSVVKDEYGSPLVVYHGTNADFTTFDINKAKPGFYGKGFYFTAEQSQSNVYGQSKGFYLSIENPLQPGATRVTQTQIKNFLAAVAEDEDLSIENYGTYDVNEILKRITSRDAFSVIQDINATTIGDFGQALSLFNKVNGTSFDGVITPTEYVVYDNTKIKSATDNIGTFYGSNPDTL